MLRALLIANLSLVVIFPLAWFAPLMRAGLLPLFGLDEISVLSGIAALWEDEKALAILVALLALVAPMAKTLALALVHLGRLGTQALGPIAVLGKLAMADIFLIAVYIAIAQGLSIGRVETAWGLWLFTGAVLASYAIAIGTDRLAKTGRLG
ncbi:MAG: paraquat-inducible protein A [Pseudomonadota bacterium]